MSDATIILIIILVSYLCVAISFYVAIECFRLHLLLTRPLFQNKSRKTIDNYVNKLNQIKKYVIVWPYCLWVLHSNFDKR